VRIRFLSIAFRDLDEIKEYIGRDNPAAAQRVVERIATQIDKLKSIPYLGRSSDIPGTRTLVVPNLPYVVIYELARDEIVIAGVMLGARNWQNDPRFR
jgi:toxin ParE1/3/4